MAAWTPELEVELNQLLKDWLKQQGRTQADLRRSLADGYVFFDYMSIPQRNKNLQALSISSLALYASMPAFFVVIAPPAYHEELRLEDEVVGAVEREMNERPSDSG